MTANTKHSACKLKTQLLSQSHLFIKDELACLSSLAEKDVSLEPILWDQYMKTIFLHGQNVSLLIKNSLFEEYLHDINNTI